MSPGQQAARQHQVPIPDGCGVTCSCCDIRASLLADYDGHTDRKVRRSRQPECYGLQCLFVDAVHAMLIGAAVNRVTVVRVDVTGMVSLHNADCWNVCLQEETSP